MKSLTAALWAELLKVRRSKIAWITVLAFLLLTTIDGLFMFILQDPERAKSLGLLGAKAQLFGGAADWPSFINLTLVLLSVGGLIIFGFIFVWIFGREFSDKTIYDLLALPTPRFTIVVAKLITATCWSLVLILLTFALMLVAGSILQLPGGSSAVILDGFRLIIVSGLLTLALSIPFAMVASLARGYLPAVGGMFLALVLGQIITQLGYGQYYPWTIPMFYSGAVEALTGKTAVPLELASYILVAAVSIACLAVLGAWWRSAYQT